MAARLPTGTVTFLFTDIEGSTRLVNTLGARYPELLGRHHALVRERIVATGGVEVQTEGDAFFVAFASAPAAIACAAAAQRALASEAWPDRCEVRVRMGIHTGQGTLTDGNYVGLDIHRAARSAPPHMADRPCSRLPLEPWGRRACRMASQFVTSVSIG